MMPMNREGLFVHAANPVSTCCFDDLGGKSFQDPGNSKSWPIDDL
jgi:hypothetical protein